MSDAGAEARGVPTGAERRVLPDRYRHPTGTFTPFRPDDIEQSVAARFEEQARRHPGRVAVASRDRSLTYAALNAEADHVAHALLARNGAADRPVAALFPHSVGAIVGLLGVIKSGRPYVCLDPGLPTARLAWLIEDSLVTAVVTDAGGAARARGLVPAADVLEIDAVVARPLTSEPAGGDSGHAAGPDASFNLTYTSGSTGQPKGVFNSHRNILDTIAKYTDNLRICPEDRVVQLAACSSNASVLSIFGALLNGAALLPFDLRVEGAARLATFLAREAITLYHSVPTAHRRLLDVLPDGAHYPALRAVCLGGEAVYRRDVERHRERLGGVPLVHGLGSTELTMIRQYFVDAATPLPERRVPVGYPIPDRDVLLLDGAGRPVGPGEPGEIVLRSRFLALGYWRRPELTREAFVPDPADPTIRRYRTGDLGVVTEDGCLTHLGRQDLQVKIHGYRIELAEIELALLELPGVREVAVVARPGRAGEQELVAYVVPAATPTPSPDALRAGLESRLPAYMIPSAFVALSALPVNVSGKVDRQALPAPGRTRALPTPPAPPGTPLERALVAIWADVLELDAVGIHDDFLALGGNSLLAMQILARIGDLLEGDLLPGALFEAATVARMADLIVENHAALGQALAAVRRGEVPGPPGG